MNTRDGELFSLPRYRLNVLLLRWMGQWPYQSKTTSFIFTLIWVFMMASILTPEIHLCLADPTIETIISSIPPQSTVYLVIIKMVHSIVETKNMRKLLKLMEDDWRNQKTGVVYDIMLKYSNNGHKYTVIYLILFYNFLFIFLIMPLRSNIMYSLGLSKKQSDFAFAVPVNYWVDNHKYRYSIEVHMIITTMVVITTLVAFNALFIIFAQHVCGIFATICYKLENIPIKTLSNNNLYNNINEDKAYWIITDCIKQHNEAIAFCELLRETYTWSFFCGVGTNVILIIFSLMQITTHISDTDQMIQYIPFASGQIWLILIESTISQQLMNHSGQVDQSLIMMKWYGISLNSRKLLNLISARSRRQCEITAGPFFTLSVEFFVTVMKTSFSYFMVLSSVREG